MAEYLHIGNKRQKESNLWPTQRPWWANKRIWKRQRRSFKWSGKAFDASRGALRKSAKFGCGAAAGAQGGWAGAL